MEISSLARNVIWNGFLALIPVAVARAFAGAFSSKRKPLRIFVAPVLFILWLAFLPNTCYLLTEWRHFLEYLYVNNLYILSKTDHMMFAELCMLWVFYFLYSAFGMLLFALAIRPIEHIASRRGLASWFIALPFFAVLSLGVYLGLVQRFNSWDVLSNFHAILNTLAEVSRRPKLIVFIFSFGAFLWFIYETLDIWVDGVKQRLGRSI